jgi:hypothetical protein
MDLAAKSRSCQRIYHFFYFSTAFIITPANSLFLNLIVLFGILVSTRSCFLKQLQLLWRLPIQQGICYIGLAAAIWG